ncbi:MAG: glycosyltransferase family 2 protein [Clostridia bacterium]|nr:glycosyltransferase family 2 protein [Clostridia bacterium]
MKVSVVVTAHHTEKYLRRCIDSVLAQTLEDIELILVNDGSPDDTAQIMREYDLKYANVKYIDIPNSGVSRARNIGFEQAEGEYVIFVDSDDYMQPTMLEKMYWPAKANDCAMAVCNFMFDYEDGTAPAIALKMPPAAFKTVNGIEFAADVVSQKIYLGFCVFNKLFKTTLLRESGVLFTDREEVFAEDAFFYFQVAALVNRVAFVKEPLYHYCRRAGSVMNSYKPNLADRLAKLLGDTEKIFAIPEMERACSVLAFLFFIDIIMNEIEYKTPYKEIQKPWRHPFYAEHLKNVPLNALSARKRLLYLMYKMKMYRLVYVILCQKAGKELGF